MGKIMKIYLLITTTALLVFLIIGCSTQSQTRKYNMPSLHASAGWGSLEEVKSEINGGKNVNSIDAVGQTALMFASMGGRLDVVKYLIKSGAYVNAQSMYATTALSYASLNNRIAVMEYLLEHGTAIDATTSINETALFTATKHGQIEAVSLLLRKNATTKIRNWEGKTVLDVAKKHNRIKIELMILEAAKKEDVRIAAVKKKEDVRIAAVKKEAIQKEFRMSQKNGKQELLTFIMKYPNSEFVNEGKRSIARIDEITKNMKSKEINRKLKIGKTVTQLKGIIGDPQFSGPRISNTKNDGSVGILHVVGTEGTWLYCEDYPKDLPYCGVINIIANQKGVATKISTGAVGV